MGRRNHLAFTSLAKPESALGFEGLRKQPPFLSGPSPRLLMHFETESVTWSQSSLRQPIVEDLFHQPFGVTMAELFNKKRHNSPVDQPQIPSTIYSEDGTAPIYNLAPGLMELECRREFILLPLPGFQGQYKDGSRYSMYESIGPRECGKKFPNTM